MQIDLNADLGEAFGPWMMGDDTAMLDIVTSANVACGGHASDPETMFRTLQMATDRNVVIGAHPGYADREGFGRRVIPMAPAEIGRMIAAQIGALYGVAALAGAKVGYIKLHGALANLAAADQAVANAVIEVMHALPEKPALLAISGTVLDQAARAEGLKVHAEIFADRAYQTNGQLMPRSRPGAVIHDPVIAADRLLSFLETGQMAVEGGSSIALAAQSICVHGDTPGAVKMACHIRSRLESAGIKIAAFL